MLKKITALALGTGLLAAVACGSTDAIPVEPTATLSPGLPAATPTSGPGPVNSNQPIPQTGDVAPDFTLPSANSGQVTLSALAAEQPVVLVFYRAFW